MVHVKVSYQTGNERIVVHNNDAEDGPTVYTREEAEELQRKLNNIL